MSLQVCINMHYKHRVCISLCLNRVWHPRPADEIGLIPSGGSFITRLPVTRCDLSNLAFKTMGNGKHITPAMDLVMISLDEFKVF